MFPSNSKLAFLLNDSEGNPDPEKALYYREVVGIVISLLTVYIK